MKIEDKLNPHAMLAEVPEDINVLAYAIYKNNVEKGFYEKEKNIGEMLCLIHSEVSEALEADRKDRYSAGTMMNVLNGLVSDKDFVVAYKKQVKGTFEEEMADIFIRVLDLCAFKGIDIEQHVKAKMRYNLSREKYHGKKY
jgi:NTP pyrophosphatase (non-canonical NTP hydrolase)